MVALFWNSMKIVSYSTWQVIVAVLALVIAILRRRETRRSGSTLRLVPSAVTRLIGRIAKERGLLAVALISAPLTWLAMTPWYDLLEQRVQESVSKMGDGASRRELRPLGSKQFVIYRSRSAPFLSGRPVAGASSAPAWAPADDDQRLVVENLSTWEVVRTPNGARVYEALARHRSDCKCAECASGANRRASSAPAAPASSNAPALSTASPGAGPGREYFEGQAGTYDPSQLRIELNSVRDPAGAFHVVLEAGIQETPGRWVRLPWWAFEGASNSNALLTVTRDPWIPAVRLVSIPNTTDAFAAWLKAQFLADASAVCSEFGKVECLKLSQKELEKLLVPSLEESLANEVGCVGAAPTVVSLSLFAGVLQWLMVHSLICAILTAGCKALLHVAAERRQLREAVALSEFGIEPGRLSAMQAAHRARWSVGSMVLDMHREFTAGGLTGAREALARCGQERASNNRSLGEWAAQLNFYGLLGTLLFIALGMSSLRLHPNPAVTGAALTAMTVTMGQAFYTTIVSATLARVVAWSAVWSGAAEDEIGRQALEHFEGREAS